MKRILTFLGLFCLTAKALVPPHPDLLREDSSLEQHHPSRRRLKEYHDSNFSTQLLNPMVCQHLTNEECQDMDAVFVEQSQRVRRIMQTSGTVKTLVVLVQFEDHTDRELPTKSQIRDLFHYQGTSDTVPTGSVADFLRINSYGQFQWETTILDWTVTDGTEKEYAFNTSGLTPDFGYALHPILDAYEARGFDFSEFDQDGDGWIDSMFVLHSGYAAEIGGEDCYNGRRHIDRIWSHAISGSHASWISSDSSIRGGTYMVTAAQRGTCDSNVARIGVLTHELLHTVGLPDLYDGNWIGVGLGLYDIMSNPYGIDGGQTFPAHLSPWCKIEMGWLDPVVIRQDGEYFAEASAITQQVYKLDHGFPPGEYLLIENRQPMFWDAKLYDGGLLIYHIDDAVPDFNMNRGYPGQSNWPWNGRHYRVALVQADQDFDLEKGLNSGGYADFYFSGRELGPAPVQGTGSVNPELYPNTNSYQNGDIQQTGIRIFDVSDNGPEMSFRISGVAAAPPTNPPVPLPTSFPTPTPTPQPTPEPAPRPSLRPTPQPTPAPTPSPTQEPTPNPTTFPTPQPTPNPTPPPTPSPTAAFTPSPTRMPTRSPTPWPTRDPTPPPEPEPSIKVTYVAYPRIIEEPGEIVSYTVAIENSSSDTDPITITSLFSNAFGNLAGEGTCEVGMVIQPGIFNMYACQFTKLITGTAGELFESTVVASGVDDEGIPTSGNDNAFVTVIVPPTPAPVAPPTAVPTPEPTLPPTLAPTPEPTPEPTPQPTPEPTPEPTPDPTPMPTTAEPSHEPTVVPSASPSARPSLRPISLAPTVSSAPSPFPATPEPTDVLASGSGNTQLGDRNFYDPPLRKPTKRSGFFRGV